MLSAQQVAQKWSTNTAGAGAAMKAGVMAVTQAPTQAAAAAIDRYQAGVLAAVSSGRMATALNAVSLTDWQNAMITKGISRVPQGVTAAMPKMQAFMDKWLPYQAQVQATVARMPKGSLADSQARAAMAISMNAAFSKRLAGS